MFGFGKSTESPPTVADWPQLLALLENADASAAIQRSFPDQGRESFLAALRRIDSPAADDLVTTGHALHGAAELVTYPVIAIAGMLNSGKTSLVSTFLSPAGRARTLRGVGNAQGTHRFVLWLPERWRAEPELWKLLLARLGESLGNEPEPLADSVEQAHRQYSNRDGLEGSLSIPSVCWTVPTSFPTRPWGWARQRTVGGYSAVPRRCVPHFWSWPHPSNVAT